MKSLFKLLNGDKAPPEKFTPADEEQLLAAFMAAQPPKPKDDAKPPTSIFDTLDAESIYKTVGAADFSKFVDPAKAKLALGGDEAAFAELLTTAIRGAVAQSTVSTTNIMQAAFKEKLTGFAQEQKTAQLEDQKKSSVLSAVASADDVLKRPEGQFLAQALAEKFRVSAPNASPEDITAATSELFGKLVGSKIPPPAPRGGSAQGFSSEEEAAL